MTTLSDRALQSAAEEYARCWIVAAYKRLILTMDNPDDVASAFEIAFIDGYLTGYTHALRHSHKALTDGGYNSIRETLALIAEGEGKDEKVYQRMAKCALVKLDEFIAMAKETK